MNSSSPETSLEVAGKRICFAGKLGGVNRREAYQLVRDLGGIPLEEVTAEADLIIIGADQIPLEEEGLLDDAIRQAAAEGKLELLHETQWWQRLGLVEGDQAVRRLYTPAMLAELLGLSVAVIRRWRRTGLIVPVREVHRLPYFDFSEVATARRLAQLVAAGASPKAISQKLEHLARFVPGVDRPLAQLSIIIEGRELLLRKGEGLIDSDGQRRLDFYTNETAATDASADTPTTAESNDLPCDTILHFPDPENPSEAPSLSDTEVYLSQAANLEDEGRLNEAAEAYRTALALGGPHPETCFLLAEVLYRIGQTEAARERYSMAIELDQEYVEARASLGCVLAEVGEVELAIAAFQGVLEYHPEYPDAQYHLARLLDSQQRHQEAEAHWQRFLHLSPDSPWAEEARQRLGES